MNRHAQTGSILISLIVTITVLSALTAAILSFATSSSINTVNIGNINRAYHLAESGMRYSKLVDLPENSYLTVEQNENGVFRIFEDSPPPAVPHTVATSGFRIAYENCIVKSTGIIGEGTLFEVSRSLEFSDTANMPCCWHFESAPNPLFQLIDECGGNAATLKNANWECGEGKIGGGLSFDGGGYVETDFKPFCGIGNGNSFTVALWAKPNLGTDGMVLGVNDGESRFGVGIAGKNWMWAYGDVTGTGKEVVFGEWQYVSVSFDIFTKILTISVADCSGNEPDEEKIEYGGSATLPETVKNLFIGAENQNGNPRDFFEGLIDEINIYQSVVIPEKKFCIRNNSVAYYPFNDDANDESLKGETFDGEVDGATQDYDRFDCPDKTYYFEGSIALIKINQTIGEPLKNIKDDFPFSISAWFKVNQIGGSDRAILGITDESSTTVQFGVYLSSAGNGRVCLNVGDSGNDPVCGDTPIDDGKWHHVVGVFQAEKDISFFVDGKKVESEPLSVNVPFSNVSRMTIGNWVLDPLPVTAFDGSIDEVAVFDEPLPEDIIRKLSLERPAD